MNDEYPDLSELDEGIPMSKSQLDWIQKWPNRCLKCEGSGIIAWTEYHDGHRFPGEQMTGMCDCLAADKCPRCSEKTFAEGQDGEFPSVCSVCSWDQDNPDSYFTQEAL